MAKIVSKLGLGLILVEEEVVIAVMMPVAHLYWC
jgi:hypothetical protein